MNLPAQVSIFPTIIFDFLAILRNLLGFLINIILNLDQAGAKTEADRKFGYCVALYDFQAENAGELGFKEGQTLKLYDKIDENWYEGALESSDGEQTGIFPTNYVRVTQPIPNQSNTSANGS